MPKRTTPYVVKDFPKKPKNLKKPKKKVRWEMDEPKRQERINLYKKCPKCILVPPRRGDDRSDPENYKFPVCTKLGKSKGKCQFNCTGIVAANRRARLTKKYPKVVALTSKLIEKWQCTKKAQKKAVKKNLVKKRKPLKTKPKPKRKTLIKKKVSKSKSKPKKKMMLPKRKTITKKIVRKTKPTKK